MDFLSLFNFLMAICFFFFQFGASTPVIIKEGSIGSLLVKMPWKGEGCVVEVDELELVLAPCMKNDSPAEDETCSSSQDGNHGLHYDLRKREYDSVDDAAKSTSGDVHEGVKTIAKMVKWLLSSFHVKIKRLIVAFDPYLENDETNTGSHTTLVLRILETECQTCISESEISNGSARVESFLGISQLTNIIKFQEVIVELLQIDDNDDKASFGEFFSGQSPTNTTTPVVTGKSGGFSGNLRLNIPWKNGSPDIRKVDADVSIDPVELRLQPSTIKWLLLSWETVKNLDKDCSSHMHYRSMDSINFNSASNCHSSTPLSAANVNDKMIQICGRSSLDISSLTLEESITEGMLPGAHLISDWVSANQNQKDGIEELDFGARLEACATNVYILTVMEGNYCLHSLWGLLVLITVPILANDIEILYRCSLTKH